MKDDERRRARKKQRGIKWARERKRRETKENSISALLEMTHEASGVVHSIVPSHYGLQFR